MNAPRTPNAVLAAHEEAAKLARIFDMARDAEIRAYEELVAKFMMDIFGVDDYVISDFTTLDDFYALTAVGGNGNAAGTAWETQLRKRIYDIYGIDCGASERLLDVMRRVHLSQHPVHVTGIRTR